MFKKKIVVEQPVVSKPKKLKTLDLSNCKITELNIKDIVPNVVNNVLINIDDSKHCLVLPKEMMGEKFKHWSKSKGGIFSRDVRNHTFGKNTAKYILLEKPNERSILRLVNDEEVSKFESLRLIDGIIKDNKYMLLLSDIDKLTSSKMNTKEELVKELVEEEITDQSFLTNKTTIDTIENISLFEN